MVHLRPPPLLDDGGVPSDRRNFGCGVTRCELDRLTPDVTDDSSSLRAVSSAPNRATELADAVMSAVVARAVPDASLTLRSLALSFPSPPCSRTGIGARTRRAASCRTPPSLPLLLSLAMMRPLLLVFGALTVVALTPVSSAARYDFVDFVGDAILMVVPQIILSLSSSDELLILNHSCLELRSKCLALRLCVVVGRFVSERKPHVLFDWYLKTR